MAGVRHPWGHRNGRKFIETVFMDGGWSRIGHTPDWRLIKDVYTGFPEGSSFQMVPSLVPSVMAVGIRR